MAEIEPLRALHYDLDKTGGLQPVLAPPYDVIDAEQRAELEARSPYNVVRIDLPVGDDPYAEAARILSAVARAGRRRPGRRSPPCGRSSRTTPGPTANGAPAVVSSRACAWRTTAPAASARTSAPTPAPRRTASGSREPRRRTSRRSSRCSPTRRARPGARSSHTEQRTRGARRPTTMAPSTGCGASRRPTRSTPSSGRSTPPSS